MVTKKTKGEKKGRVKVGKLKLNKEAVKALTSEEKKRVKGGIVGIYRTFMSCPASPC